MVGDKDMVSGYIYLCLFSFSVFFCSVEVGKLNVVFRRFFCCWGFGFELGFVRSMYLCEFGR